MALHPGHLPEGALVSRSSHLSTLALYPLPHALGMGDPSCHPAPKPDLSSAQPWIWKSLRVGDTVFSPNFSPTSGLLRGWLVLS